MPAPLSPRYGFDALHPRHTAFLARTSLEATRWLFLSPWRIEALTGTTLTCMGSMPLICHESIATEAALAFFELSGLPKPHSLLRYRSEAEAVERARECVSAGMRIACTYPPPRGADGPGTLLVPLDLYGALNDKARLAELVSPAHVPPRRIVAKDAILALAEAWPGRPVFVKASIPGAHGAGRDLRCCTSAAEWRAALEWLHGERDHLDGIVVEDALRFVSTWCLAFTVLDEACLHLGAAEQLFSSVGTQSGSRIDPHNAPPDEAVALGLAIARRAQGRGYRGLCGFDVGADEDGRIFAFDLNFRMNASTVQVLLHDAATRRIGAAVSQSFVFRLKGRLGAALDRLRPYAEEGRIVPLRIFDAGLVDAPDAEHIVSGMLLAADAAGADALAAELSSLIAPLAA